MLCTLGRFAGHVGVDVNVLFFVHEKFPVSVSYGNVAQGLKDCVDQSVFVGNGRRYDQVAAEY
jgi:hypothetical protein